MIDVYGLGHCCLDYLCVLNPYPSKGKKGDVTDSMNVGGGPVPTALTTLVRMEKSTHFCGIVGNDPAGRQILDELRREGVDIGDVVVQGEMGTPRAFILIDPADGSRTIALDRTGMPSSPAVTPNREQIESSRIFLSDGRFTEANLSALKWARDANVTTVFDTGAVRPGFSDMLPLIDYAVVSADLSDTFLPGAKPVELAKELVEEGVKTAVVTTGERGAVWVDEHGSGESSGFVIDAYDTTGAGDVFHGGFIYGLLENWKLERTLLFASAAAALSTRRLSGVGGIPRLSEVLKLLGW